MIPEMSKPIQAHLSSDGVEALKLLLGLVHYDLLAYQCYMELPEELRVALEEDSILRGKIDAWREDE